MTLPAGHRVGPYTVVKLLERGGFSDVYVAEDGLVRVALKVLNPREGNESHARETFRRDVMNGRAIHSRNVARIHRSDLEADPPWIAYELLSETSLKHATEAGISKREALAALLGAAKGLRDLHEKRITHRDVTLDNILVIPGDGLLLDLGIATTGQGSPFTMKGFHREGYRPPEFGGAAFEPKADIWQWGVAAATALLGHRPFPFGFPQYMRRLRLHPEPLSELICSCLSVDPADRPLSGDLVAALEPTIELADDSYVRSALTEDVLVVSDVNFRIDRTGTLIRTIGAGDIFDLFVPDTAFRGEVRAGDLVWIGTRKNPPTIRLSGRAPARILGGPRTVILGFPGTGSRWGWRRYAPKDCPSCGAELERFRCRNTQFCPPQVVGRLARLLAGQGGLAQHERLRRFSDLLDRLVGIGVITDGRELFEVTREDVAEAAGEDAADPAASEEVQVFDLFDEARTFLLTAPYVRVISSLLGVRLETDAVQLAIQFRTIWEMLAAAPDAVGDGRMSFPASRVREFQESWDVDVLEKFEQMGLAVARPDADVPILERWHVWSGRDITERGPRPSLPLEPEPPPWVRRQRAARGSETPQL